MNDIHNQSLIEEYSPNETREAYICPVWKEKNKQFPKNYHPIPLTNILSKSIESIIREEIIDHMIVNKIIDINQHGPIKGWSTVTLLLQQQSDIFDMIENGENCEIMYLDFTKSMIRLVIR